MRKLDMIDAAVEPIRWLEAPLSLEDFPTWGSRRQAREANPYRVGDVVWMDDGARALVVAIFVERIRADDPSSDLLPVLRVRPMTKGGAWSKAWRYVWPGHLARGAERAGVAQ